MRSEEPAGLVIDARATLILARKHANAKESSVELFRDGTTSQLDCRPVGTVLSSFAVIGQLLK